MKFIDDNIEITNAQEATDFTVENRYSTYKSNVEEASDCTVENINTAKENTDLNVEDLLDPDYADIFTSASFRTEVSRAGYKYVSINVKTTF